jgi:hypothetical protein
VPLFQATLQPASAFALLLFHPLSDSVEVAVTLPSLAPSHNPYPCFPRDQPNGDKNWRSFKEQPENGTLVPLAHYLPHIALSHARSPLAEWPELKGTAPNPPITPISRRYKSEAA